MTDRVQLICWKRANGRGTTKAHVDVPVPDDDEGRTACGRRWPRHRQQAIIAIDGEYIVNLCKSCERAMAHVVPTSRGVEVQIAGTSGGAVYFTGEGVWINATD